MDERIELSFNVKSTVPVKTIKDEIARQQSLLDEYTANPDGNETEIAEIKNNLAALYAKKKYSISKKVRDGFDSTLRWILWAILIIYCLSLIVLPVWMILTSFKSASEYSYNKFGLPKVWYVRNFSQVLQKMSVFDEWGNEITVWNEALNSILWAGGSSAFTVFLTTCMAYVIAKYKFPGRNLIYNLGIIIMIVPIVGNLPSAMVVRTKIIPTYDNMLLTILTGPCTCFSGLYFMLLYGAFKEMPWDYAEQVFVDGGNHFTAFIRMYFPMILPTSMVMFILIFLGAWNDYSTLMLWLPSSPNLAYGLYMLKANSKVSLSTPALMAGFTLIVIPTVAIYIASQKLILSKFTVGGLKG